MSGSRTSLPLLVGISIVWGSSWIANSMLGDVAPPLHLAVFRYGAAFLFLEVAGFGGALVRRNRSQPAAELQAAPGIFVGEQSATWNRAIVRAPVKRNAQRRRWHGKNILLGCTMFALPELLILAAAEHGAAAFIPLVYAALPLGLSIGGGALRLPAILAPGAMLVLLNGSLTFTGSKLAWALLVGVAVALQGWSLFYARAHLSDVASRRGCMAQAATAFWVLIIALQVWPEGPSATALRLWPASAMGALCVLAGLGIAGAYPLYYSLLTQLEPAQLAVSTWMQTIVAVGESAALMHQWPGWQRACAAVALLGCAAASLRAPQQSASPMTLLSSEQR